MDADDVEIAHLRAMLAARPRPTELSERRKRLDMLGEQSALPAGVRLETVEANGVAAEWTLTPGADPSRVMLYAHGGGYISGSIVSHRALVAEAGRQGRMRTLALDYRLAPEHPYPAALDDVLAAYAFLLSNGIDPQHIALAGDSAGAGLTLAAMISLRAAGLPLPACGWCISPWIDLRMSGASMTDKAPVDPLIQKPYLEQLAASYLAGTSPDDPHVSPLLADLRGLPPLLIQAGSAETLLDDAVRIAGRAAAADVAVSLEVYPKMIHVWPLFHEHLGAGRLALASAGRFLLANTGASAVA